MVTLQLTPSLPPLCLAVLPWDRVSSGDAIRAALWSWRQGPLQPGGPGIVWPGQGPAGIGQPQMGDMQSKHAPTRSSVQAESSLK